MEKMINIYNLTIHPTNIRIKGQNTLKLKAVLLLKLTVTLTERNTSIQVSVGRVIIILERRRTSPMKIFQGSSKRLNHQLLMAKQKNEKKPKHGCLE